MPILLALQQQAAIADPDHLGVQQPGLNPPYSAHLGHSRRAVACAEDQRSKATPALEKKICK
ncbi:hypothetical protein [Pseudorhodoferax aquiterrae]|uniref:hypothetical protein n=1 Tax=Pseudorhodoferax aquiterrae TaxID=747304 RepID=UPI0016742B5E|nr:hypothetical protein [Pseudorhodoferax aquiterrae]